MCIRDRLYIRHNGISIMQILSKTLLQISNNIIWPAFVLLECMKYSRIVGQILPVIVSILCAFVNILHEYVAYYYHNNEI